ncbi:hypothetical protein FisN_18Hh257 [Fistulifera solaris]|uniref:Uncharacterized protein n=1 Tax=Fistulifera solaris TaxID=1519565 RepID=A0A1Z5KJB1_FISSO|nr:hypothetical protein FisN_18Hh257 [Fistulifera solaris]|eukprot:GAX26141.1 hypothetical protein FisN_18Hh257 [Fistulifera solaris]
MFKVKRRIRSIREKKQSKTSQELVTDPSNSAVTPQRGILKSDNSCRSSQSPNSLSIWASNSSPSASAAEEAPIHTSARSVGSVEQRQLPIEKPRRVHFDSVRIREYERTLGDNPSCSSGAPITLGWSHGKESKVNINDYESVRQRRRNQRELTLSRMAREELLLEWGATFNEIIEAIRTNVKIKHQRRRTVNSIGTYDKLEEAMERAGRKLKKTLLPQKGSGSQQRRNNSDSKYAQSSASDSPVSSISSEPVTGHTTAIANASDDSSQTSIRRSNHKTEQIREITVEGLHGDEPASNAVPIIVSRESFASSRPIPTIEIPAAASCASAMSVLEDDFDEDGYDDFEDLLDPYITEEGDRMYPSEIHLGGDYDLETLTDSYAGYSMHTAEGFETLTRDQSHWRVEAGSTNSGPKVKPVFNPITIYEDGPDDPGQYPVPVNYPSVEMWQRSGFQMQPPPQSSSFISRWE